MADVTTGTTSYVPVGVNEGNLALVRYVVPTGGAGASDTLTFTVPPGMDPAMMPATAFCPVMRPTTPGQQTYPVAEAAQVKVTYHDNVLGQTRLTNGGTTALLAGDEIFVLYVGWQ